MPMFASGLAQGLPDAQGAERANVSRILYVATSDIHLKTFHVPYLEWLAAEGHTVDIAAERRGGLSFACVHRAYWLPFPRTLAPVQLYRTFRQLRKIVESGHYDLVHCHTPIPSALTRLAGRGTRKRGGAILYTAHGFHFFRGAPWYYWLGAFPVECWLSRHADGIVTINREDYRYAQELLRCPRSYRIPGIGVDTHRFQPVSKARRAELRHEFGFADDDFLLLYIAEFIPRKNHAFIVKAARDLFDRVPTAKLVFLGTGRLWADTRVAVARMGLSERILFPGFRWDVECFAAMSDVAISSSRQEGLGFGLAEPMACGVPVVATMDRGHRELVEEGITGFLYPQHDAARFVDRVAQLYEDPALRASMSRNSLAKAQEFRIEVSLAAMANVYRDLLGPRVAKMDGSIPA